MLTAGLFKTLAAAMFALVVLSGCGGKDAPKTPAVDAQAEMALDTVATDTTDTTGASMTAARESVYTNIEMVFVEGGTFTMGCTSEQGNGCDSDENPAHSVTVSNFSIGKYEVTQGQWKAVMGNNPGSDCGSYGIGDNYPVYCVSWNDIQTFISTLNSRTGKTYRLPTEAEWEYAARGGNGSNGYKYSGSNTLGDVAWYRDNSGDTVHIVGTKSANELGIYDMSGNVWEWVSDWYNRSYYSSSPSSNPTGPNTGSLRVLRGGSWSHGARIGVCLKKCVNRRQGVKSHLL